MKPLAPFRSLVATAAAVALALTFSLPASPARAKEDPEKQARQAAKEAEQDARAAAEADKQEAKRAKKQAKEEKDRSSSKDAKRRAQIESGARTAVDWYGEALSLYQRGKYLDARSILLPLEDSARAVDIQEKVKLLIADTYFEQGGALNLAEALARYKAFLTFYPGSENAAYAQYQLGRSYFKQLGHPDRDQSFTDQAIFEYQKLIENYPDSEYVAAAEKDVLEAKARRAQHEFEVAQFYWDWNDKRAAAIRLQQVLKERPELPAREKALWMCAQALYDTGQRVEGDAYAARLAADYPGSAYLTKLNPDSPGAIDRQLARERKNDKEADHLRRVQAKQDRRRTRIVRKDSGLPADVPQTWDLAGSTTQPAASAQPAASSGAAPAATPSPAPNAQELEKQRQREEAQRAQSEKLEREEQERNAKEAERAAKKEAAQQAEAEKAAQKRAKEEKALEGETPQQKAEREKAEARAKKEADRLEAEEAKRAEKLAAQEAKRKEKQDAEDAKKAAKKKAKGK